MNDAIENQSFLRSISYLSYFISILNKIDNTRDASNDSQTYCEYLGYDTLVPDIGFAKLLNSKGEIAVSNTIARIRPEGTYIYDVNFRNSINMGL